MVVLIEEVLSGKPEDGFTVKDAEVVTYPKACEGRPAGFSMLTQLPPATATIEPDPFVLGSRALLEAVVAKVMKFFSNQPDIVAEWETFADAAPSSDCVQTWCLNLPLDIPLKVIIIHLFISSMPVTPFY